MKKRIRKVANFLAFNLLFFALYLNFIHQDKQAVINVDRTNNSSAAAFSGTMLVEHPEKYLEPGTAAVTPVIEDKAASIDRTIN